LCSLLIVLNASFLSVFYRLAALVGPLAFFLTSQLYATFLEGGELSDGMPAAKTAASLLPAMAFYLGASVMAQYVYIHICIYIYI